LLQIGITAILVFAAFGQSPSAGTTFSLPAVLAGGSKGVPSNLNGTISVFDNRVEFEAFPQVEYLELPCNTIKGIPFARAHKNVITIVSADTTYRFELRAGSQSQQFVATLTSNCKISSKGLLPKQK
jgi:hypothetical protein